MIVGFLSRDETFEIVCVSLNVCEWFEFSIHTHTQLLSAQFQEIERVCYGNSKELSLPAATKSNARVGNQLWW